MMTTYHGILKGDRIEWDQDRPVNLRADHPVQVFVTIIQQAEEETIDEPSGEKLFAILEEIAAAGGIQSIPDPLAWEREQREDRELPGRPD